MLSSVKGSKVITREGTYDVFIFRIFEYSAPLAQPIFLHSIRQPVDEKTILREIDSKMRVGKEKEKKRWSLLDNTESGDAL
jgi:hypothetical protein